MATWRAYCRTGIKAASLLQRHVFCLLPCASSPRTHRPPLHFAVKGSKPSKQAVTCWQRLGRVAPLAPPDFAMKKDDKVMRARKPLAPGGPSHVTTAK